MRASIALALVAAAAFVGFRYSNTGNKALRPELAAPADQSQSLVVAAEPERVPLTRENRVAALTTAQRFIRTAVERKNLAESWTLAHPDLRQGMTRAEWLTGDIPVVPFPVATARWKLDFSYRDTIGIQVLLYPRRESRQRSMAFAMELKAARRGDGDARRWLVSQWAPMGGTINQRPPSRGDGESFAAGRAYESPISAGWIFVPIGSIVGVLVALPLFLVAREWRRRREAEERWRADVARRARERETG